MGEICFADGIYGEITAKKHDGNPLAATNHRDVEQPRREEQAGSGSS